MKMRKLKQMEKMCKKTQSKNICYKFEGAERVWRAVF
jgi:hypothetical protein